MWSEKVNEIKLRLYKHAVYDLILQPLSVRMIWSQILSKFSIWTSSLLYISKLSLFTSIICLSWILSRQSLLEIQKIMVKKYCLYLWKPLCYFILRIWGNASVNLYVHPKRAFEIFHNLVCKGLLRHGKESHQHKN